jgi:hypothetical protein
MIDHQHGSSDSVGRLAVALIFLGVIGGLALRVAARRAGTSMLKRRLRIAGSVAYSISFMAVFAIFMAAMASL